MIAVTALIFKAVIGAERTFPLPGLIVGEQERRYENPVTSREKVHGGCSIDKVSGDDDMVQLIPFALILMGSRIIQNVRIGKKVVQLFRFDPFADFSGCQYLCDASILCRIVEIAHNQYLRVCTSSEQGVAKVPQCPGGIESVGFALFFTSVTGREKAALIDLSFNRSRSFS